MVYLWSKKNIAERFIIKPYSSTIWRIVPGRTPSLIGAVCTSKESHRAFPSFEFQT